MTKKENIIILGKLPPPYMGPSIATEIILNSSLKEHYNLIHSSTKINAELESMGSISLKKIIKNIGLYVNLFRLILKYKPKLVLIPISQTAVGFFKDSIYILISKALRRKVVIHLRGSDFKVFYDSTPRSNKFFVRQILSLCDGVIVLGHNLKYIFQNFFQDDQIYVVPNGANYMFPVPKGNDKPLITSILYLANLQASKGIEDVILAFVKLKEKGYNFTANIVGSWRDDATKEFCLNLVETYDLPVEFHPVKSGDEKLLFFSNADIFIFTPRKPEGHPWVIVEALAAGLPVISTDQGAIIESVLEQENGFIVSPNNPEEIRDRLMRLIDEPLLLKDMAKNSRKHYLAHFTEEKMVENLRHVFDTIITKNKG